MKTCEKVRTAFCLVCVLFYGAIAAYAQDSTGTVPVSGSSGGVRRGEVLVGNDVPVELIRKDFAMRKEQGDWRREAPQEHVRSLSRGVCPADGSAVVTFELPATGGYTDLWNKAYYCKGEHAYWVDHGNGALVGTVSLWYGPFPLGTKDGARDGYRFKLDALLREYSGVDRIFVVGPVFLTSIKYPSI